MFRMNGKNRKKVSKEKNTNQVGKTSENKQKYQEDFNEIILNDLVPEEKRNDFGLDSVEESKPKKSGGVKLNLGLGSKKSASKGKKSSSNSKDTTNKKTKQSKNSSKTDKSKQEKSKENSKKNSDNHVSKDKGSNKTTKKNKSLQSNAKEIKQELSQPIEQNTKSNKKTNIGLKKKRTKQPSQEKDSETKRSIDENYISENNFDAVNYRAMEELEPVVEEKQEEIKVEEQIKNRHGNLVWSEDKFPKK